MHNAFFVNPQGAPAVAAIKGACDRLADILQNGALCNFAVAVDHHQRLNWVANTMRKRAETNTQRHSATALMLPCCKALALNAGGQVMAARLDRMTT